MSRRLLIIFGSGLLLLIIVVVILFAMQKRTTTPANTNSTVKLPNINTVILNTNQATANANTAGTNTASDPRTEVQQLARNFAGIYASLSSQGTYKNITDLYFAMTPDLKADQEAYVAQQQKQTTDTSTYHGITSVPRVITVQDFDETAGTASVKVTLQRVETSGTSSNSQTYNQDITLGFERIQGAWKVGRITWSPKQ